MRPFVLAILSVMTLFVLTSCGSVMFNSNNSFNATEEGSAEASGNASEATSAEASGDQGTQDCDAYMQDLATKCFNTTVFDENGLLLNDVDENGNVLGPVDQNWARSYCNCFAQRSFQDYGCVAVQNDESLDNDAWLAKYSDIRNYCAEVSSSDESDQSPVVNPDAVVDEELDSRSNDVEGSIAE